MKLGSLFDGVGGFPLAAQRHEIEPVWASEVENFCIKVTEKHFPNMKHLGDITKIKGNEIEPVDIITAGSPCQDLSVAGKRAGLEGARSGLFMEFIRIVREMREATNNEYPRFIIWENVPGAFSSNSGNDFRAVLEEITETKIPMPKSGRWADAGMVRGHGREIAWRCLDAQYWGVPQRRKRIFLVCDFRGECAGEILFEQEGLRRDTEKGSKKRKGSAGDIGDGVEATEYDWGAEDRIGGWVDRDDRIFAYQSDAKRSTVQEHIYHKPNGVADSLTQQKQHVISRTEYLTGWDNQEKRIFSTSGVAPTLSGSDGGGGRTGVGYVAIPVLSDQGGSIMSISHGVVPTLRAETHGNNPIVPVRMNSKQQSMNIGVDVANTLGANDYKEPQVVAFQPGNLSRKAGAEPSTDVFPTLGATTLGDQFPHVATYWDGGNISDTLDCSMLAKQQMMPEKRRFPAVVIPIHDKATRHSNGGPTRNGDGAGNGLGVGKPGDPFPTLTAGDRHAVAHPFRMLRSDQYVESDIASTIAARDFKGATDLITFTPSSFAQYVEGVGTLKASGGDLGGGSETLVCSYAVRRLTPTECERLQGFPDGWASGGADTARYKALGNSLAVPCVEWIMSRIAAQ